MTKRGLFLNLVLGFVLSAQQAFAGYDIGAPTSGPFAKIGAWIQDYINFMDGPFAVAAVIVSIIFGVLAWNFAPKDGVFGKILRAIVSAIVILNVGTWVTSFVG